jgi:hypothetical protein
VPPKSPGPMARSRNLTTSMPREPFRVNPRPAESPITVEHPSRLPTWTTTSGHRMTAPFPGSSSAPPSGIGETRFARVTRISPPSSAFSQCADRTFASQRPIDQRTVLAPAMSITSREARVLHKRLADGPRKPTALRPDPKSLPVANAAGVQAPRGLVSSAVNSL